MRDGISKYDPRHPRDRQVDASELAELCLGLRGSIKDCGFLRLQYDLEEPQVNTVIGDQELPDETSLGDVRLVPGLEVEVVAERAQCSSGTDDLAQQRLNKLYEAVGLVIVDDDTVVDEASLRGAFE